MGLFRKRSAFELDNVDDCSSAIRMAVDALLKVADAADECVEKGMLAAYKVYATRVFVILYKSTQIEAMLMWAYEVVCVSKSFEKSEKERILGIKLVALNAAEVLIRLNEQE